jgi:catechol 2,3-dioxygenase-like lactoylglutathione lyase family enzyme
MMRFEMLTGNATVLAVENIQRATDYYRDRLGFIVAVYEEEPEHYGTAQRDNGHVHFAHEDGAKGRPNHEVIPPHMFDAYFWPDDVERSTTN